MAKLRKMLCDINSQECKDMMALIETQSKHTLAAWAVSYAKKCYLPIYEKQCPQEQRLAELVAGCEEYVKGDRKLAETKPLLKEATQIARDTADDPIAQAAARAVSTGCSVIQTPTSALGFLFYGAAAAAYSEAGLEESAEVYDAIASREMKRAYEDLNAVAVPDEQKPAKIKWNC